MKKYIGTTIRKNVNDPTAGDTPAVGVNVTVKNYPANTDATIYSDDGVTIINQPLVTDASGKFEFYAADGRYNIVYDFNGDITSDTDVAIFDDIEKASLEEALAGLNDTKYTTPYNVDRFVRQFGIGNNPPSRPSDFNLMGFYGSGFYASVGGTASAPFGQGAGILIHTKRSNSSTEGELDGGQLFIGSSEIGFRFDWDKEASTVPFIKILNEKNFIHCQNLSANTIASNATTAGSNLNPAQIGAWRNVSGADVLNNSYCLFQKV